MGVLFDAPAIPALPALTGSEAQLKWANQVRPKKIAHCGEEIRRLEHLLHIRDQRAAIGGCSPQSALEREHMRCRLNLARERLEALESIASAHEWIEMRDRTVGELLGLDERNR